MSGDAELDLQRLVAEWQAAEATVTPADQIRNHVKRRSRLLTVWFWFDELVGLAFLVFLTHRAITNADPIEKLAMATLALITAGAMVFGGWNWHGALRPSAEDTRTFVAISAERSRRLARSVRAAWVVLAAQVAVFTPWVYYRLYGGGRQVPLAGEVFGWGLLAVMIGLAAVFVRLVQAWGRRDAASFEQIRRELED
jgi:hypothetical protein